MDNEQLDWFVKTIEEHPFEDGWQIFCFSHAPIIGSGLRVLQECHVVNGCCWLNHSGGKNGDPKTTTKFIELVRKHRCIKGWFSGHFHLGQDYRERLSPAWINALAAPCCRRAAAAHPVCACCATARSSQRTRSPSRRSRASWGRTRTAARASSRRRR